MRWQALCSVKLQVWITWRNIFSPVLKRLKRLCSEHFSLVYLHCFYSDNVHVSAKINQVSLIERPLTHCWHNCFLFPVKLSSHFPSMSSLSISQLHDSCYHLSLCRQGNIYECMSETNSFTKKDNIQKWNQCESSYVFCRAQLLSSVLPPLKGKNTKTDLFLSEWQWLC